ERTVKWMMPALFLLLLGLVAFNAVSGGFDAALSYLFRAEFAKVTPAVWLAALSQAFFSIGAGIAGMMTYGAYLPRRVSIGQSALVIAVADERVATRDARAALAGDVARADAVWNLQHSALLVHALHTGALDDISAALTDRLHQDARAGLMPTFAELRGRSAELGALGVTLSGAGPSVLVWCAAERLDAVAAGVRAIASSAVVHAVGPEPVGLVCG
ncbi:MAG: hypothetical protein ACO3KD_08090, partial [Gaiellales bacterium]